MLHVFRWVGQKRNLHDKQHNPRQLSKQRIQPKKSTDFLYGRMQFPRVERSIIFAKADFAYDVEYEISE
jgi:hypothetical protein